jgi:polysaccharide export outer membrane protein
MTLKHIKLLLFSLVLLASCRSSQELIYLKDLPVGESRLNPGPEHRIKPGDILYVSVKSMNPDINAIFNPDEGSAQASGYSYQKYSTPSGAYLYGFEVKPNGVLTLPVLGKLKVEGLPQQKIEELVQLKADSLLKDAQVKVKLLNFKVTVLGEVRTPGVQYNYNNTFTVLDAIAQANGNTDFASIKRVKVVRPGEKTNTSYLLDLTSKDIYTSEAFYLQPNDYVFVEPDKYKNFQLNSQAWSMGISSVSMMLAILAFALK